MSGRCRTQKSMTTTKPRVQSGVPAGGEFASTAHSDAVPALTPPPANPAAVLASSVGTDKDPNSIPWPEKPANSRVEVYVDPDDLCGIMDNGNWNATTNYTEVYASIDLIQDRDCDFWGIDADGNSHVIALGVHDYEEAVDPYSHENLRYREGFTNPMPPYLAAQKETKAKRLEAATALLAEAGITVELEDLRREQFRLRHGSENLRLETTSYDMRRVIETTNWREAGEEDYAALLGGGTDEQVRDLLVRSAVLVARDLKGKGYKDRRTAADSGTEALGALSAPVPLPCPGAAAHRRA